MSQDVDQLLHAIFQVCEATEETEPKNDFERGRVFEAKRIRKGIGTWFQDTFCGRSFMGEPVLRNRSSNAQLQAAIEYLDSMGWQVVPKVPLDPMVSAGCEAAGATAAPACCRIYSAMLAAAPQFAASPSDDLSACLKCGGPADNGHDRCIPPAAYYCTKCAASPVGEKGSE